MYGSSCRKTFWWTQTQTVWKREKAWERNIMMMISCMYACLFVDMQVCVCVYIYIYIYIYTHTHTHTHTQAYIYIYLYWVVEDVSEIEVACRGGSDWVGMRTKDDIAHTYVCYLHTHTHTNTQNCVDGLHRNNKARTGLRNNNKFDKKSPCACDSSYGFSGFYWSPNPQCDVCLFHWIFFWAFCRSNLTISHCVLPLKGCINICMYAYDILLMFIYMYTFTGEGSTNNNLTATDSILLSNLVAAKNVAHKPSHAL